MNFGRQRRPVWEIWLVGVLVSLSLVLSVALYSKRDQVFKERLMIMELATLRNHLATYMLTHKKRPHFFYLPWTSFKDPFGNPYRYNSKKGRVQSSTESYENW